MVSENNKNIVNMDWRESIGIRTHTLHTPNAISIPNITKLHYCPGTN